jgi:hypothetical protein
MKNKREKIYSKFDGKCAYCGSNIDISEMHVDHIIPKSTFSFHMETKHKIPKFLEHLKVADVNHQDNLFPTCSVCNLYKLNFSLEDFRTQLSEIIDYLENRSRRYRLAKRYNFVETKEIKPIKFYFEHEEENRNN